MFGQTDLVSYIWSTSDYSNMWRNDQFFMQATHITSAPQPNMAIQILFDEKMIDSFL